MLFMVGIGFRSRNVESVHDVLRRFKISSRAMIATSVATLAIIAVISIMGVGKKTQLLEAFPLEYGSALCSGSHSLVPSQHSQHVYFNFQYTLNHRDQSVARIFLTLSRSFLLFFGCNIN